MENKTPRTDDREFAAIDMKPSSRVVYASFARQLERELADKDRQLAEARDEIKRLEKTQQSALDAAEMLWVVLANVGGGDWSKQTSEWQIAAEQWRDNYLKIASDKVAAERGE